MLPAYAELACRSNFSFLTGASHPEELVARARALRYAALAITDEGSLSGVVRAHAEARRVGLPLIVGASMQLAPPVAAPAAARGQAPATAGGALAPRLVLLAQTRRGWGNLAHWISVARRRAPKGQYLALTSDLEGKVPEAPMLAGLPDCLALLMTSAVLAPAAATAATAATAAGREDEVFETLFAQALWLRTWFGAERCALALPLLLRTHDARLLDVVPRVAALTGLRIVAVGDVLMHARSRKPLQDVLTATRLGRPLADCGHALEPNAEAHLRSRARLARLYRPEWLQATLEFAGQCRFSLDELRYEYPDEIVPAGHTPTSWLRQLTEEGLRRRYRRTDAREDGEAADPAPPAVRAIVEHELALIAQLRYEPYFLTVAELVHWARAQGILCQGRGSAANSAVCYALGVTEVDPARMSVLFERFISAERNEPPDIDIDFEHQRREEVIQHVYRKYGRHRAALTAVLITYRTRSALRDVGRALGIDLDRIDAVARSQHRFIDGGLAPERLREHGFDPEAPLSRLWLELSATLTGFPRHLSQHPGGFVIAREHIARLVPVENAAMPGRSVIQWDKDDLDALGLIKVDLLALGMLSAIRRALALVAAKLGRDAFAMQDVPAEDAATYEMLCRGDSVGVFQVESRAQMSMLPRLQPRGFYDLVIQVAIVRPGPIQGGMVHPYLRRRQGLEPEDYPSEEVRQALARTLGVPIFQEQVMQLAMLAADFTPGEADQLRRAMAAWKRKGGLGPFHERLVGRMRAKGYSAEFAERIFRQIEGFGEYGFPESHAASFALLVYVSAWLKCHHPDAFLAALLNSQPLGFYAPAQLVRDARAHGVVVLPVDVTRSAWESTLEPDAAKADAKVDAKADDGAPQGQGSAQGTGRSAARCAVRLGLHRIHGLAEDAAQRVLAARAQAPFADVEDLARRAQLDARALGQLAAAGALAVLAGHRHHAAWAVAGVDTRASVLLQATRTQEPHAELAAPDIAQELIADYRSTGLSLCTHPLALLRAQLAAFGVQPAALLQGYPTGRLARASGLVTHRQRPATAAGVVFVTLEDESGTVNVICWPQLVRRQQRELLGSALLTVYGVWQREGEVRHLIARRLVDHTPLLQGLNSRSRDFR